MRSFYLSHYEAVQRFIARRVDDSEQRRRLNESRAVGRVAGQRLLDDDLLELVERIDVESVSARVRLHRARKALRDRLPHFSATSPDTVAGAPFGKVAAPPKAWAVTDEGNGVLKVKLYEEINADLEGLEKRLEEHGVSAYLIPEPPGSGARASTTRRRPRRTRSSWPRTPSTSVPSPTAHSSSSPSTATGSLPTRCW